MGEVLKILNELVRDVEQVIDVPKIPWSSRWSYRRFVDFLRQPQTGRAVGGSAWVRFRLRQTH